MKNCRNCGAPLRERKDQCEYCGSVDWAQRRLNELDTAILVSKGLITINEARTVLYADDMPIEIIEERESKWMD